VLGPDGAILFIGAVMLDIARQENYAEMRQSLDQLQQTNQELEKILVDLDSLASTDKLTGAWNRRRLEEALSNEMDRLKRYSHPLSLLIIDVDSFRHINDLHGEDTADQVLIELAAMVQPSLRAADSLTRWGGDEFVVLCPNTPLSTVIVLAQRLREQIAKVNFSEMIGITVSIGVAQCLPGETQSQWFDRADAALYRAKAKGRNQVQIAG
jgi:diguanylate cyclase (GGDEF)-like protein